MDISVVINCSDEMHILETLDSIDEDVEIICSITPNPIIGKILKNKKIPYAITPNGSHSVTTNAGIQLVTNDKFILMDSDCVFAPGAIRMMGNSLNEHLVVNGRI